jgi:hydroxyacylglutathione hydrolase
MDYEVIRLSLGGIGNFNCYLIKANNRFILIDTGVKRLREKLQKALDDNGCTNMNLKLVILTNGTMDSIGNAFYVKQKYKAKIAIHKDDKEMLEKPCFLEREFYNKSNHLFYKLFVEKLSIKMIATIDHFCPDIVINNSFALETYDVEGKVIHIPGFTEGSIGVLLRNGELLSGNTIINMKTSYPPFVFTNYKKLKKSTNIINDLNIRYIYPGMGDPIKKEELELLK